MSRSRASRRRARLNVESLEVREVPANNLTVVAAGIDDSADVKVTNQAQTITIATKKANAIVSLSTIQDALSDPQGNRKQVVLTTAVGSGGTNGNQAGNIVWDATTAGNLDFTGFVAGKTLTLQTVSGAGAVGKIDLTAVGFHNSGGTEQFNLVFDTTSTNGSVSFHSAGPVGNTDPVSFDAASILDFTVTAGTGAFSYDTSDNVGAAGAGGLLSISAGGISIDQAGGMAATGNLTVTGSSVNFGFNAGLSADGNLSVISSSTVSGFGGALTALAGSTTVSGTNVNLASGAIGAGTTLGMTGTTSLFVGGTVDAGGDISFTGGTVGLSSLDLSTAGKLTVDGSDLTLGNLTLNVAGDLTLTGTGAINFMGNSTVTGGKVTVTATGAVSLSADDNLNAAGDLAITGTSINADFALVQGGGSVTLTGPVTMAANGLTVIGTGRDSPVSFSSTLSGPGGLTVAGETISFGGTLGSVVTPLDGVTVARGVADLGLRNVFAKTFSVGDGVVDPLGEATLSGRGTITLYGDPPSFVPATLTVYQHGNLNPGGLGTTGDLTVLGNVYVFGGDIVIDLGPASDRLIVRDNAATTDVEGDVTIDAFAGGRLGGGQGTGALSAGAIDVPIIDFAGAFTGTFYNAPLNTPVIVGTDAIQVTSYDTDPVNPAGLVTISSAPAALNGIVTGADPTDGTIFTAKLSGGGTLVAGKTWDNRLFLVVRDSTPASKLMIATKANGSDDVAVFGGGVLVNGSLAAFAGKRADIGDQFRATGTVKSAVFRDLISQDPNGANSVLDFGGLATDPTSITARNVLGSVRLNGIVTKLAVTQILGQRVGVLGLEDSTVTATSIGKVTAKTVAADVTATGAIGSVGVTGQIVGGVTAASLGKFSAGGGTMTLAITGAIGSITGTGPQLALDVTAGSVGSVTVSKGTLGGALNGWNVIGGVGGIKAGAIAGLTLKANNLGAVKVTGALDLSGDIGMSSFILSGDDGTSAKLGLKSLSAVGRVANTLFDVKAGNVGAVSVGRFALSQLYLNYTPDNVNGFNLGGAFGASKYTLASFKTTAVQSSVPTNQWHDAFMASEIAAPAIGTVTLSSLRQDNSGVAFGIKAKFNGAVVVVKAADAGFPANKLNVAVNPTAGTNPPAINGDFYFMNV